MSSLDNESRKENLEKRLKFLVANNVYYVKAFGYRTKELNGDQHVIHYGHEIAKWDRNDLDDFEEKILKLEAAKKEIDDEIKRNEPLKNRSREYRKIDTLLLEAIAEKEGGRTEKMEAYLKLRNEIRVKYPVE